VYCCFFADDFGLAARDTIGIDRITFESDFPHQDSSWPHTNEYFEAVTKGLADLEIYKIARGNALRMLDLEETLPPDPVVRTQAHS
jgi:hypothetical protein